MSCGTSDIGMHPPGCNFANLLIWCHEVTWPQGRTRTGTGSGNPDQIVPEPEPDRTAKKPEFFNTSLACLIFVKIAHEILVRLCSLANYKSWAIQITCLFHVKVNSGYSKMSLKFGNFWSYYMKMLVNGFCLISFLDPHRPTWYLQGVMFWYVGAFSV